MYQQVIMTPPRGCPPPLFWLGLALGCAGALAALQLPYVNWHRVAAPVDARPLVIRHDAKGDGRFAAPRSGGRSHRGIDLEAELDSPVRAIRSGTVVQVGEHRGLGRFIEVEHRGRLRSVYAHLNEVRVEPGARVRQGQLIGTVGKSGNARHPSILPHLHLELAKRGELIDPQTLGLEISDEIPVEREASSANASVESSEETRGGE